MSLDDTYELCLPILQDAANDEEKADKLEEFLRDKLSLTGPSLEKTALEILWRHRSSTTTSSAPPPLRHTVIRRSSPAPWQIPRAATPLSPPSNSGTSPATGSGFPVPRGGFARTPRSLTASPFTSPRPSPRLAFAQPIPHSPNLNAYEFSEYSPVPDIYNDFARDNVDWLVSDDTKSSSSSTGLSGAAPEWVAPAEMNPYDMIRSILGENRSNEEIEAALEANGYDFGVAISALSEQSAYENGHVSNNEGRIVVGKSMAMDNVRPVTPSGPSRNPNVCKYWITTGQCLRADCRFSHETDTHICKYWLAGNCLASASCPFSHDPSALAGTIKNNGNNTAGPITGNIQQPFQLQDTYEQFPALQSVSQQQWSGPHQQQRRHPGQFGGPQNQYPLAPSPGFRNRNNFHNSSRPGSRPGSRPTSRHQQRELNPAAPSVDDPEAFPSLGSLNARVTARKQQAKRGGSAFNPDSANNSIENSPAHTAASDAARASPSPASVPRKVPGKNKLRDLPPAVLAIPAPQHVPWLQTGERADKRYMSYRIDAMTHSNVRNKFMHSAAQAWHRNDSRAAKTLSIRGQAENEAMRRCYREAARRLYDAGMQNIHNLSEAENEVYVDLHGLTSQEATDQLQSTLLENEKVGRKLIYAIITSGPHNKIWKDKNSKAVKNWLGTRNYVYREFNVPAERLNHVGAIVGIDPKPHATSIFPQKASGEGATENSTSSTTATAASSDVSMTTSVSALVPEMGRVQLLKREKDV